GGGPQGVPLVGRRRRRLPPDRRSPGRLPGLLPAEPGLLLPAGGRRAVHRGPGAGPAPRPAAGLRVLSGGRRRCARRPRLVPRGQWDPPMTRTIRFWGATLALLAAAASARADSYYVVVFGAESKPQRPKYSHSWAVFVRVPGCGQPAAGTPVEAFVISWMPRT